jgi:hypothetical protein
MALQYFGSAVSQQRGSELAEPGISVASFEVEYAPEIDEEKQNNLGETDGAVVSSVPSRTITIEGEVTGSTGRMADTFTSAVTTIANDMTTFGGSGGIYLKRAVERQGRAIWRAVTLTYRSRPGIA